MTRAAAAATEPAAQGAATQVLADGGTATDAVIAGFLAAGAARAGVLLAPVQVLVVGSGVGARAFDGRARQPGRGAKRPRGVLADEAASPASRVAVAASIGALALAHAYDGQIGFARLAKPASEHARSLGAGVRADVIARIGERGPSALHEPFMARPLIAVAGAAEGGLLTGRDLAEARPASDAPKALASGGRTVLVVPWSVEERSERAQEVIVAADPRGVVAVLAYGPDDGGVAVPELELVAPRDAIVVRRGVPRLTPGEPLPAPAPLAICVEDASTLALGFRSARSVAAPDVLAWGGEAAPATTVLATARAALGAAAAVGILVVRSEGRLSLSAFSQ